MIGTWSPVGPLLHADGLSGGKPIHLRHLHVHQDQVEGILLPRGQGRVPVAGNHGHVPPLLQQAGCQFLIELVILRNEDAETT